VEQHEEIDQVGNQLESAATTLKRPGNVEWKSRRMMPQGKRSKQHLRGTWQSARSLQKKKTREISPIKANLNNQGKQKAVDMREKLAEVPDACLQALAQHFPNESSEIKLDR